MADSDNHYSYRESSHRTYKEKLNVKLGIYKFMYMPNIKKEVVSIIYEKILKEKQRLEQQVKNLQLQLQALPEGKLIFTHNGKYVKWHVSDGHNQVYIPKKERKYAEKLALKKYLTVRLENTLQELNAIKQYLNFHNPNAEQIEQELINSREFTELLSLNNPTLSQELYDWMHSPYERNNNYPEGLTHKTYAGDSVRSKSESMIYSSLYKNQIPFRYECLLQLGDICLFPDFTMRHPKTGEILYWEHFGKMDDPNYSRNTFSKLQLYISNGIIPGNQLITTFETRTQPLDMEKIEQTIEQYFL